MARDGGLVKAIEDELTSLKATTLAGIASLDRDFTPENSLPGVRLILSVGSNRETAMTCQTEFRSVSVMFHLYAASSTAINTQGDIVESLLWDWSENAADINARMDNDCGVREMRIADCQSRHEQTGNWSVKFSTEWEIQLNRS